MDGTEFNKAILDLGRPKGTGSDNSRYKLKSGWEKGLKKWKHQLNFYYLHGTKGKSIVVASNSTFKSAATWTGVSYEKMKEMLLEYNTNMRVGWLEYCHAVARRNNVPESFLHDYLQHNDMVPSNERLSFQKQFQFEDYKRRPIPAHQTERIKTREKNSRKTESK